MNLIELILIAVGLSMDAFAVSICSGLTMSRVTIKKAAIVGLYFGIFQGGMPVLGYLAATLFAESIIAYDHWVAFALLGFIGGRMIFGSLRKEKSTESRGNSEEAPAIKETSLSPKTMLPLAVATSIDALAVGVSFAFLQINIVPAVTLIGVTTFLISMLGVKIGNMFGLRFKSRAEFIGGTILILLGVKILLEHLEIINF